MSPQTASCCPDGVKQRCERSGEFFRHRSARTSTARILHDHWAAIYHRKGFAKALDPRPGGCGRADVDNDDVVLRVIDHLVESELELDLTPPREPALKNR
jgi:hypothetical protein